LYSIDGELDLLINSCNNEPEVLDEVGFGGALWARYVRLLDHLLQLLEACSTGIQLLFVKEHWLIAYIGFVWSNQQQSGFELDGRGFFKKTLRATRDKYRPSLK
jgi:hypothetical protein